MSHIFISYSHKNREYVEQFAKELASEKIAFWLDKQIDYGSRWPHVIQEHLDTCSALVLVMSSESYQSDWVQNELARAQSRKIPIFPLLLQGDIWLSVQSTQCTDVRSGSLPPTTFFDKLREALDKVEIKPQNLAKQQLSNEQLTRISFISSKGSREIVSYFIVPAFSAATGRYHLTEDGENYVKIYNEKPRNISHLQALVKSAPKIDSFVHNCLAWPEGVILDENDAALGVIIPNIQKTEWMEPLTSYSNLRLWMSLPVHRRGNFEGRLKSASVTAQGF